MAEQRVEGRRRAVIERVLPKIEIWHQARWVLCDLTGEPETTASVILDASASSCTALHSRNQSGPHHLLLRGSSPAREGSAASTPAHLWKLPELKLAMLS
jgi:hypothetical protein